MNDTVTTPFAVNVEVRLPADLTYTRTSCWRAECRVEFRHYRPVKVVFSRAGTILQVLPYCHRDRAVSP